MTTLQALQMMVAMAKTMANQDDYISPESWEEAANQLKGVIANYGWQPIETAPQDGTVILAWINDTNAILFDEETKLLTDYGAYREAGFTEADVKGTRQIQWADGIEEDGMPPTWFEADNDCWTAVYPTHWMPLPEPPK